MNIPSDTQRLFVFVRYSYFVSAKQGSCISRQDLMDASVVFSAFHYLSSNVIVLDPNISNGNCCYRLVLACLCEHFCSIIICVRMKFYINQDDLFS